MQPSQTLLIGIPGLEIDSSYANLVKKLQPGGFIIFGRNIKSPEQLRKLTDDLRSLSKYDPIICIDQEGGRVARLREIGYQPASAKELVEANVTNVERENLIKQHGKLTGQLMSMFGINLDLCPVLDISFNGDEDNSLKNRCWGTDPETTIVNATHFNSGLHAGKVLSCGKHFPGYSRAKIDPHHELPRIERSSQEMYEFEWRVFKFFTSGNLIDCMMMGHAFYPQIDDSAMPSSLSPYFIDLLRDEWGFKGTVMTDDLDMGAIINSYSMSEAIEHSLNAGNDFSLICHRIDEIEHASDALEKIDTKKMDGKLERIHNMKKKLVQPPQFDLDEFRRLDQCQVELRKQCVSDDIATSHSPEDAKRSPVEDF